MMKFTPLLLGAAALALSACTTADQTQDDPTSAGRDCFRAEQAAGYEVVDDHNIRVRVNPSRSYTLHTTWNANDLDWTTTLALHSDTGWICTGNARGSVEVTGGTLNRTYPIQSITRDPPPPGTEGS
jgi:hypothetical protein